MPARRLDPDEADAWARVRATVRPLLPARIVTAEVEARPAARTKERPVAVAPRMPVAKPAPRPSSATPGSTLDAGWDKRISRGALMPDRTIDLHGHNLASAHARLDLELDRAVAHGDRVVLLVTGRPPRPESERPHARGAIRAAIGDWLAMSRHAGAIAAVRAAHPRHGGAGALYLVLRRARGQAHTRP